MERILDAAADLCRVYGAAKTNVCDIATSLKMSSANIYRFFPSKSALHNALVARVLETNLLTVRRESRQLSSAARLREFILGQHRRIVALIRDEQRTYELLATADEELWPAFDAHALRVRAFVAELIRDGIRRQEFRHCNSVMAAECFCTSTATLWKPKTAKRFRSDGDFMTPDDLVCFSVEALRNVAPHLP
ncbi:TetR/AcrR family transcriptional regulator [Sinorhizobium meliloti]|uniref:TetR/AcrR family transcriptional regulator n=1 Tax=Rhizobium meliloti TaxID=382 RepID=UPI000FD8E2E8|nr:TetR/AcrR family transcriptional regulator [Sinorhizobium meliloti]RVG66111.1 TetR/AcrR family transcriptional regulator [Sinorhizobium meliloti]